MVNEPFLNSLIQASIGRQCVSRLPYLQEETEALSLAVQTWEQARTGKWNELLQQLRTTQCHGKATEAGITDPAANRAFLLAMNLDDPADEPLITAALRGSMLETRCKRVSTSSFTQSEDSPVSGTGHSSYRSSSSASERGRRLIA